LKAVADHVSLQGHPIYTVDNLGFNIKAIDESAKLVRSLIDEKKLDNVIILAHSKGGLIAKYLLAFENEDNRVKKAIAIASPFHGSNSVKYLLNKEHKELGPDSPMIAKLNSQKAVNDKIVSVFCRHDNHVWPTESCYLEGAKNIQVDVFGHHKILYDKKVHDIVLEEIDK
jgi:pimeloyl-ACP methyl ester carboxylesterase